MVTPPLISTGSASTVRMSSSSCGEFQLHPHPVLGLPRRRPRLDQFVLADQPVIAAIDVLQLRPHLLGRADQQRLFAGVAGMVGDDHALAIEHLQHRKLAQIGESAVLHHDVGQKDGVGAGLIGHPGRFGRSDQAALHQVLDRVGGAATEDA